MIAISKLSYSSASCVSETLFDKVGRSLTSVCCVFGYKSFTKPLRLFNSSPILLASALHFAESSNTSRC